MHHAMWVNHTEIRCQWPIAKRRSQADPAPETRKKPVASGKNPIFVPRPPSEAGLSICAPKVAGSSPVGHPPEVPAKMRKMEPPVSSAGGSGSSRAAVDQPNASSRAVAATSPMPGSTCE
jgi:hypothetical protein